MTRQRLPDWEQRLFTFLNDARTRGVEWGRFDCALGLASGAVLAQTGVDIATDFKGRYDSEKAALKLLKDNGWGVAGDAMAKRLTNLADSFLKPARTRHRGNIVLLMSDLGPGFGVRVGREAQAFSKGGGMRHYPIPFRSFEWTVT